MNFDPYFFDVLECCLYMWRCVFVFVCVFKYIYVRLRGEKNLFFSQLCTYIRNHFKFVVIFECVIQFPRSSLYDRKNLKTWMRLWGGFRSKINQIDGGYVYSKKSTVLIRGETYRAWKSFGCAENPLLQLEFSYMKILVISDLYFASYFHLWSYFVINSNGMNKNTEMYTWHEKFCSCYFIRQLLAAWCFWKFSPTLLHLIHRFQDSFGGTNIFYQQC